MNHEKMIDNTCMGTQRAENSRQQLQNALDYRVKYYLKQQEDDASCIQFNRNGRSMVVQKRP